MPTKSLKVSWKACSMWKWWWCKTMTSVFFFPLHFAFNLFTMSPPLIWKYCSSFMGAITFTHYYALLAFFAHWSGFPPTFLSSTLSTETIVYNLGKKKIIFFPMCRINLTVIGWCHIHKHFLLQSQAKERSFYSGNFNWLVGKTERVLVELWKENLQLADDTTQVRLHIRGRMWPSWRGLKLVRGLIWLALISCMNITQTFQTETHSKQCRPSKT